MSGVERDYIERTIETVRIHRDAENSWPQWANIFADEIERLWGLEEQLEATERERSQGLPDSATQLDGDVEILRAELETLRDALEQVAYGLWGDMQDNEIVTEVREIARHALASNTGRTPDVSDQESRPE